ncbi:ABC transporter family substrate-binding protein [Mobilicoccus sp.]|uniref:ABC transporter family substrate-binding protein n=1 Tax=Mobilicoccus sp. TaxID=2034349 RepID=UPI0028AB9DD0|nr:ABC transporter family substrate-binding protein [Mobilicoccus sp.]
MKSRRIQMALVVAMSGALVLSGCAGNGDGNDQGGGGGTPGATGGGADNIADNPQPRENVEDGGTFTRPLDSFPTNYNEWHVDGNLTDWNTVMAAVQPGFYLISPEGEFAPRTEYLQEMPTSENKDGKQVITYKMNPKAVWNDGAKIDWKSFEATWKANRASVDKEGFNNVAQSGYEDIEKVEQGGTPEEVRITMKKPFYPVQNLFASVLHPKLGTKDAFNTLMKDDPHPELRSGPFVIDKLDKATQTVTLKQNPKWWGNKPKLDTVIFRQMEDSANIPAFSNGEIDMVQTNSKARMTQVQNAPDMEVRRSQDLGTRVFIFNSAAPSLKDTAVRKALWQGLNPEELKKVRWAGMDYTEKPVGSAMFYAFQPYGEDNLPVHFDAAAAEKTLQDAGYVKGSDGVYAKDGKKLTVRYTAHGDDPVVTAQAQTIQNQLKAIGIDLQLDMRSAAAFGNTMEKRDFDFLQMGWVSGGFPISTSAPCQFYCTDSTSNYSKTGTPELDARIKKLGEIENQDDQVKEMNAIEKEWMAQGYGQLPWANGPDVWAFHKGVANYGPALFRTVKWEDVGWQKGFKK